MSERGESHLQPTLVSEIKRIIQSRNEVIRTKADIALFVEQPLLEAAHRFWDLNIKTTSSSANDLDITNGEGASIILDFDMLSQHNKAVAEIEGTLLHNYDGGTAVDLRIPLTVNSTVEDVSAAALEKANKFKKQRALWIPSFNLGQMRMMYGRQADDTTRGIDDFIAAGMFYDEKSGLFYWSNEHYEKAQEVVEE